MGVASRAQWAWFRVQSTWWVTVLMASATTSLDSVVISSKTHQPLSIRFPKRSFGKKRTVERSFQPSWFATHIFKKVKESITSSEPWDPYFMSNTLDCES